MHVAPRFSVCVQFSLVLHVHGTNQVRGPYPKLWTKFFPLRFMVQAQSTGP